MNLRPYQVDCQDRSLDAWLNGLNRQLAVLATGLGKTAIAATLRAHHKITKKVMFLVHMETLAVQAANAMQRWNPDLRVGVEMAGSYADLEGFYPPEFVVASVPTLGRKGSDRIKRFVPSDFGAIIQDEAHCFPRGTLVDGRRIETISLGDMVSSVDVWTGKIEQKRVISLSRRYTTSLVKLHFNNGESLVCTPEHPFWTSSNTWVAARDLKRYTVARRYYVQSAMCGVRQGLPKEVLQQDNGSDLLGAMQTGETADSAESGNFAVRGVRSSGRVSGKGCAEPSDSRKGVLHPGTQESRMSANRRAEWEQARYPYIIGTHEDQQPNERCEGAEANARSFAGDGSSSTARRERETCSDTAATFSSYVELADGSGREDRVGIPSLLQDRRSSFGHENSNRGGRAFPFIADSERTRPTEGCVFEEARVDRVEILEPSSSEFSGEMLGTCEVYNFGVEGYNNYLAEGYIVHNCGMADSFKRVYEHFGLLEPNPEGPLFLGITATPNRTDGRGLRDLFDVIVFDMGIQKGIADGWLCDIRGLRVNGKAKLDNVKIRAGEFAQDELSKEVNTPSRNAIIVKEWYKHAYDRRTICFTVDIQHALDLAAAFTAHGTVAKAVWGDDPERHEKIRGHKSGEYPVICCAQLLGIGYDDPLITCIVLSAPRKSFVRYAQEVGRGTRIADGKEDLLVIDVGDNTSRHDLCSVSSLLGLPKNLDLKGESYKKAKTQLDRMAAEFPTANVQDIKSLDQLKSIAEHVSLFQVSYPPEISKLSELSWRKSVEGYILSVNRDVVTVSQDLRGDWMIRGRVGETVANLTAQNLSGAMNLADRFILDNGGVKGYLKRDAGWKTANVPPTGPQLGMCKRLHITVPTGATKGMVSAAIDAKMQQMRTPQPEYRGEF